jgi:hypothetical protein
MEAGLKQALLAGLVLAQAAAAESLTVPFDFAKSAIGLEVSVHGTVLYMLVDTGVDPSVIDLKRAKALGLKIDHSAGGEASGEGDAKQSTAYPAMLDGLAIAGRNFPDVEALAFDMSALTARYGRPLDGILGYSFLNGRVVLIDYPKTTFAILDRPIDALAAVKTCRQRHSVPLTFFPEENIPAVPDFRFGEAAGTISLDTGSSGFLSLYQTALDLPGLKEKLTEKGQVSFTGGRGDGTAKTYTLTAPLGFGPFTLPAGQTVTLRGSTPDGRAANAGNKLFAALKLKLLLDYQHHVMTFYGDCR